MAPFTRITDANVDVERMSDAQELLELAEEPGLREGLGKVFGHNECCADSMLQLLVAHGFLAAQSPSVREHICAQNRHMLVTCTDQRLHPRARDLLFQDLTVMRMQARSCSMMYTERRSY